MPHIYSDSYKQVRLCAYELLDTTFSAGILCAWGSYAHRFDFCNKLEGMLYFSIYLTLKYYLFIRETVIWTSFMRGASNYSVRIITLPRRYMGLMKCEKRSPTIQTVRLLRKSLSKRSEFQGIEKITVQLTLLWRTGEECDCPRSFHGNRLRHVLYSSLIWTQALLFCPPLVISKLCSEELGRNPDPRSTVERGLRRAAASTTIEISSIY